MILNSDRQSIKRCSDWFAASFMYYTNVKNKLVRVVFRTAGKSTLQAFSRTGIMPHELKLYSDLNFFSLRYYMFFSFLLVGGEMAFAVGPKDSLRNRYDLNDPRNPDCPCHFQQTKADKEFKRVKENKVVRMPADGIQDKDTGVKQKVMTYSSNKKPSFFYRRSTTLGNLHIRRHKTSFLKYYFRKSITDCPKW